MGWGPDKEIVSPQLRWHIGKTEEVPRCRCSESVNMCPAAQPSFPPSPPPGEEGRRDHMGDRLDTEPRRIKRYSGTPSRSSAL